MRRPRWVPLITGGGGVSSNRPAGVPRLVTGPLTNGVPYFEDFHAFSLATSGHPSWLHTVLAGSGTAGGTGSNLGSGVLQIATGAVSGDGSVVTSGGRTTTTGSILQANTTARPFIAQFRVVTGPSNADLNWGFGLIPTAFDATADWLTDPDSTVQGSAVTANSIVFTRHSATYSGDTAGSLIARLYETTDTDSTSLDLGTVSTATAIKVEVHWTGTGLLVYRDGTYLGTMATPNVTSFILKTSFAARLSGGVTSRAFNIDSYYQEVTNSTAR